MDSSGSAARLQAAPSSAKRISPVMRACGGSSPMMAREVIDLPEPDSPTSPRTSPAVMEKLRSRTASKAWVEFFESALAGVFGRIALARNSMLSPLTLSRGSTRYGSSGSGRNLGGRQNSVELGST